MVAYSQAGQAESSGSDARHRMRVVDACGSRAVFDLARLRTSFVPEEIETGALNFIKELLIGSFIRRAARLHEGRRSVLLTTGEGH